METIKIKGKEYKVSGHREINGKIVPVIKAEGEEIKHADGRIDVIIKVPSMELNAKQEEI